MKFSTALVKFGSVGDVALELRKALTAIAAGWNVEHNPDGTHKHDMTVGLHADTHADGGTDEVALDASQITTGTISDARLSGNVALENQINTFTANQEVQTSLRLRNPAAAANQKLWALGSSGPDLHMAPLTDDGLSSRVGDAVVFGSIKPTGNVYEKTRTVPMGHWIAVPFNAANFAGSGTMTWTVTAGQVTTNRYTLIGKTLLWQLAVSVSSLSGTPTTTVRVTLPGGLSLPTFQRSPGQGYNTGSILFQAQGGPGTTLTIYRSDGANYVSPDGAFYLYLSVLCEVS